MWPEMMMGLSLYGSWLEDIAYPRNDRGCGYAEKQKPKYEGNCKGRNTKMPSIKDSCNSYTGKRRFKKRK